MIHVESGWQHIKIGFRKHIPKKRSCCSSRSHLGTCTDLRYEATNSTLHVECAEWPRRFEHYHASEQRNAIRAQPLNTGRQCKRIKKRSVLFPKSIPIGFWKSVPRQEGNVLREPTRGNRELPREHVHPENKKAVSPTFLQKEELRKAAERQTGVRKVRGSIPSQA